MESTTTVSRSTKLKFMTINVNGIGNQAKRQNVLFFLENLDCDIVFVQETHCFEFPEWKGEYVASYGASNARGCAILMKRNIADGRLCYVDIDINGQKIRLVCVYAPNHPTGRQRFRSDELSALLSQTSKNIVAGDFNCVHSFASDTKNGSAQSEVGSSELEEMCTLSVYMILGV